MTPSTTWSGHLAGLAEPSAGDAPNHVDDSEDGKRSVDVGASLVADSKAAELAKPSQCPLHHPAVQVQLSAAVDAWRRPSND